MTSVASSPLVGLVRYYERLATDPNANVARYGFSEEKIHFQLILEPDGSVADFVDIRQLSPRGKPIPTMLVVPDGGGRSGSSLNPFFCWDNTGYVFGRDNKDKPGRAESMFASFKNLHLEMRKSVGADRGYDALCHFLERWNPESASSLPSWDAAAGMNVVFRLRGTNQYVHQSEAVRSAWLNFVNTRSKDETVGLSLIDGSPTTLARLHPMISGVAGANTSGATVVSFNLPAFESYGKSQSYNAPVGILEAFQYTTALNRLLGDLSRKVSIGDSTMVFWADSPDAADAEAIMAELFGEDSPREQAAEEGKTVISVRTFLRLARDGRLSEAVKSPDAGFYILGLSPNASRLNVRFWMAGTVAQLADRLAKHHDALEMVGAPENQPPLVIRRLLLETAREAKDIAPTLVGSLARSVLLGLPYPQSLFSSVIRRVRADSSVNYVRAAILKAYLVRNLNQEVPVALQKDHPDEAYQLGRLFAALEKTQEDAAAPSKLNATIKDRYFGAASSTPASVFPQMMRLHQHHINKLENVGLRVVREKLVTEICGRINSFPLHLSLEKQGLFHIAYYHQRQDFFTRKEVNTKETENAA